MGHNETCTISATLNANEIFPQIYQRSAMTRQPFTKIFPASFHPRSTTHPSHSSNLTTLLHVTIFKQDAIKLHDRLLNSAMFAWPVSQRYACPTLDHWIVDQYRIRDVAHATLSSCTSRLGAYNLQEPFVVVQGILTARLDAGDVEKAACPMPDCHHPLPLSEAQRLLPLATFRRFHRLLLQRHVDAAPNMAW